MNKIAELFFFLIIQYKFQKAWLYYILKVTYS